MNKLRFGFLSTANIGRKNWKAIFNSGNCVVSAIASRNLQKGRSFVRECQSQFPFDRIPDAFGSYEELIAAPNVDAVYIPLPTGLRREWVVRAAEAGKHIVCEKPCAVNEMELETMISACRRNRVQFMDGVMFMHGPRMDKVREILNDEKNIGPVRRIASAFTFYVGGDFFRDNIRVNGLLEPTGCLGDLGWYSIRFTLWTMNWQLPRKITAKILSQSENLPGRPSSPTEFSAELLFDDNVSAEFYCSFLTGRQQWVHVSGQKGWLLLPDFVHPFNSREPAFEVNQIQIHVKVPGAPQFTPLTEPAEMGHATSHDTLMFRNFANQVFSGQINEEWLMWSLKTQKVLDDCFAAAQSELVR
jgi:predicted dehydrogenase